MELYHEYTERLRNNAVAGILFKLVKRYFGLIKNKQRPNHCSGLTARLHSLYEECRYSKKKQNEQK